MKNLYPAFGKKGFGDFYMKTTKRLLALFLAVMLVAMLGAMSVTAATGSFDPNAKVSFTMNCDKPGYTFTVYRVADTEEKLLNPYEASYKPLVSEINGYVAYGSHTNACKTLDAIATSELETKGAVVVGTYSSDTDGATKTLSDLKQGIFYVRATGTPNTVKSVKNSIFALPYYAAENGWTYSIDPVELATKVESDTVTIDKTITNSTIEGQTEYTEVPMGGSVRFCVDADTVGAYNETDPTKDFRLKAYSFVDTMSKGLTYLDGSVQVRLLNAEKTKSAVVDAANYTVDVTGGNGEATTIRVSLKPEYLQTAPFYSASYVRLYYTGILNEHAVIGYEGNPNEVKLEWTNYADNKSETEPDDAWVYTYSLMIGKLRGSDNKALSGAKFQLFTSQADAEALTNPVAEGTSNTQGEVFFTFVDGYKYASRDISGKPVALKAGTYYVRETEAPASYSAFTKVIPVTITTTYKASFTNNTWADETKVQEYTEDGQFTVDGNAAAAYPANYKFRGRDHIGYVGARVTNDRVFLPQTGGIGSVMFYGAGAVLLLAGIVVVAMNLKKRSKASK